MATVLSFSDGSLAAFDKTSVNGDTSLISVRVVLLPSAITIESVCRSNKPQPLSGKFFTKNPRSLAPILTLNNCSGHLLSGNPSLRVYVLSCSLEMIRYPDAVELKTLSFNFTKKGCSDSDWR